MPDRVLITGGAGFIGKRLAQCLLAAGREVRILDALLPQVHGPKPSLPSWLARDCDLHVGDIRSRDTVMRSLSNVDAVVHLAAETGTSQSMYSIHHYADVNVSGTAILLDCMAHLRHIPKLIVASSRAVYGEGKYDCTECGVVYPKGRDLQALALGRWEPRCPQCSGPISSVLTDENSRTEPPSIYGVTKLAQERLAAAFALAFGISVAILRYQNVYGAGQSLTNPYTGIITHFFSALRQHRPPEVFEDGLQTRDFVHVEDVVQATLQALDTSKQGIFNVGSGVRTPLLTLAETMCRLMAPEVKPVIVQQYRTGDIRHCVGDIRHAKAQLNYAPHVGLDAGLTEFLTWAANEPECGMPVETANSELAIHGLLKSAR